MNRKDYTRAVEITRSIYDLRLSLVVEDAFVQFFRGQANFNEDRFRAACIKK